MDMKNIGEKIRSYRTGAGITQKELAEKLHVTIQAVSQWETGKNIPDTGNLSSIAGIFGIKISDIIEEKNDKPDWVLNERIFSEEHMFTRLKGYALSEKLVETNQAMYYAREKHSGQFRKTGSPLNEKVPYIIHPLMMACHAHAMGIGNDKVLATIMLHDVCEDCGVKPEELPFSEEIREAVALLTKKEGADSEEDMAAYYSDIAGNNISSIVKVIDRCNNVSLMSLSFSREKLIEYVDETEKYVYPLIEHIKRTVPQYYDAVFMISYQLRSIMESIKAFILRY